ncbi:---NA--- [Paramuricea clavata]|uniref:---NA n=1 Tax=Paramuricea clavata TaxID=317549 RepID=A0A6S7GW42_PARCT|nr:---NA--- [Paramuricea clavata]
MPVKGKSCRIQMMQNKVKVFPNPEMESQLAVKENQRQKVEFKGKCHNCGQKGHTQINKFLQLRSSKKIKRRCYQCGKPGHIARH